MKFAALTLLATAGPPLAAHNWLDATGDWTSIPDIASSRAIYRELDKPDTLHSYTFTAKKNQELFLQLTSPDSGPSADFTPALALILKDQSLDPSLVSLSHARLEDSAPWRRLLSADDEDGIVMAMGSAPDFESFYEPVTGTRYRIRQTLILSAPADGEYRVVIFSPSHESGKYIFAPGRLENFSLGDILGLPKVWFEVRTFMGESTAPAWVALAVIVAAALGTIAFLSLTAPR
ncbi:MAG: hypothetical protein WCL50_07595 [Spirochaetota bacterium]